MRVIPGFAPQLNPPFELFAVIERLPKQHVKQRPHPTLKVKLVGRADYEVSTWFE